MMTDLQALTLAVSCLGFMGLVAYNQRDANFETWGIVHLTFDAVLFLLLTAGVIGAIFHSLGLFGA